MSDLLEKLASDLNLDEETKAGLKDKADSLGIEIPELIRLVLRQGAKLLRVLCPECDGVFWVEDEREWMCPYCGLKEPEVDDFIVG